MAGPSSEASSRKKKVAILGGGMGAIATAFALTDPQNPNHDQYEVTLYQMGWRLGGKGASGRDPEMGDRIEEHGLHIWFGFYHNAFDVMQRCYKELNRPKGAPLRTWRDAFKPHDLVVIQEYHQDEWKTWPFNFDRRPGTPGPEALCLSPWGIINAIVKLIHEHFKDLPDDIIELDDELFGGKLRLPRLMERFIEEIVEEVEDVGASLAGKIIGLIRALVERLDDDVEKHSAIQHYALTWLFERFLQLLHRLDDYADDMEDDVRRLLILLELGTVSAYGMIKDDVITQGFQVLDDYDFREWLMKHGASQRVAFSAPVRSSLYDGLFAYPGGDTGNKTPSDKGQLAASAALQASMMTVFGYRGAIMWKMQSGMGDTVFGPFYEVLKARGVKFAFFHKVKKLYPGQNDSIERITLGVQATVKAGPFAYEPLFDVNGLPCWPDRPWYDQLKEGQELKAQKINLESAWTPWEDVGEMTLEQGKDFDQVVLGISVGALKDICSELRFKSEWATMLDKVQTVQTQACQLWFEPTLKQLGWPLGSAVMSAYADPLNSWADMSQTLPTENWPPEHDPGNVSYFCGPLKDAAIIPPFTDHEFPAQESERVKQISIDWLKKNIGHLFPEGTTPQNPNGLNWNLLIDLLDRQGEARFDAQYWRANIDPSERYVLSLPKTNQHRLKADGSGFSNLFLTGDWIQNGLNYGAIEPTTISGLLAARAISGYPQRLICEPYIPE